MSKIVEVSRKGFEELWGSKSVEPYDMKPGGHNAFRDVGLEETAVDITLVAPGVSIRTVFAVLSGENWLKVQNALTSMPAKIKIPSSGK